MTQKLGEIDVEQAHTAEVFDLQRERESRIRQATGGSGTPPGSDTGNWLAGMEERTRFLARRKANLDPELEDFIVSIQFKDVALLCRNVKGRDVVFEWFDTELFCKQWKFYLSIKSQGQENGDDQQIHEGELDRHAQPEGKHLSSEE